MRINCNLVLWFRIVVGSRPSLKAPGNHNTYFGHITLKDKVTLSSIVLFNYYYNYNILHLIILFTLPAERRGFNISLCAAKHYWIWNGIGVVATRKEAGTTKGCVIQGTCERWNHHIWFICTCRVPSFTFMNVHTFRFSFKST